MAYPTNTNSVSDSLAPGEALLRIVRNSVFNALGTALILPLNFFALFTLARRLGKESLGTFFTIFAISAVIHWIADTGVSTVVTHRVARASKHYQQIVAEAAGMLLLVSAVSVSLFYIATFTWTLARGEAFSWKILLIAAIAMITRHTLDFGSNVFRGLERFEFENYSRVLQTALFCLFVWLGVHPETGGLVEAFTAYMASNVIAAAFIVIILVWQWRCTTVRLSANIVRDWLRESMPLGFGDAVRRLTMQLDTLLLAAFRPAAAVGLFSVAYRPLQPLQLLPRTIVSVTFPMMSRVAHTDRTSLSRAFARTTNLLWIASLPIALLTTVCAEPLILLTAGPEYQETIGLLRVLIWIAPLVFVNAQLRFAFTALQAQSQYWRLVCWILAIKLSGELILIPLLGMYGAAVGHVIGELALCMGGLAVLRAHEVFGPSARQLMRVLPAAGFMALVLLPISVPNPSLTLAALLVPLSLMVFAMTSLITGALPRADVMQVCNTVVRRIRSRRGAVID